MKNNAIERSLKANSRLSTVLVLIALALTASLVTYFWASQTTVKSEETNTSPTITLQGNLAINVKNTGFTPLHIAQNSSVYIDDLPRSILTYDGNILSKGEIVAIEANKTAQLIIDYMPNQNDLQTTKIITLEGNILFTFSQTVYAPRVLPLGTAMYVTTTLTLASGLGGNVNPSGIIYNVAEGNAYTVTAIPDDGYVFESWTYGGSVEVVNTASSTTSIQVTQTDSGYAIANFAQIQKPIPTPTTTPTPSPTTAPTESPNPSPTPTLTPEITYTSGEKQNLTLNSISTPIIIQRQDGQNQPITTGTTNINLYTSSASGQFYSDSAGSKPTTFVNIKDATSTAVVWYKDTSIGSPTLSASAQDYVSAATTFQIQVGTPSSLLSSSFDGKQWDQGWDEWSNPPWWMDSSQYSSAPNSVSADITDAGPFTCNKLDAHSAAYITVSFDFMIHGTQPDSFILGYGGTDTDDYYQVDWKTLPVQLGDTNAYSPDTWHHYTVTLTDPAALTSSFRFQFGAQDLSATAKIYIDNVSIQMYN